MSICAIAEKASKPFSNRHFAKLMGWSRIHLYRVKLMAEFTEAFFDALLATGVRGTKMMAALAVRVFDAAIRTEQMSSGARAAAASCGFSVI